MSLSRETRGRLKLRIIVISSGASGKDMVGKELKLIANEVIYVYHREHIIPLYIGSILLQSAPL